MTAEAVLTWPTVWELQFLSSLHDFLTVIQEEHPGGYLFARPLHMLARQQKKHTHTGHGSSCRSSTTPYRTTNLSMSLTYFHIGYCAKCIIYSLQLSYWSSKLTAWETKSKILQSENTNALSSLYAGEGHGGNLDGESTLTSFSLQKTGRCRLGWQQQTTEWFKEVSPGLKTSRVCLFSPCQENIKAHIWKPSLMTLGELSIIPSNLSILCLFWLTVSCWVTHIDMDSFILESI